jgi:hypothetical protein
MKTKTMMVMVVAGLAVQGLAWGADPNPSASANVQKPVAHNIFQQILQPKGTETYKIERYGGVSSRPWAQTTGFSAAPQTQFMSDRERLYEPNFNLFWVGRTPR